MYQKLDKQNWKRKEHFEFFNQFDDPFFGITTEVDCTNALAFCKSNSVPFFLYYHFQAILAVNKTEEFRYRIKDDEILVFERIHVTTTISRPDNTFGFSFVPFTESFGEFSDLAKNEIDRIRNSSGICANKDTGRIDVIHFSTVPWIKTLGVTHPRNSKFNDSVPKITFGKFSQDNNRIILPVSIHAHHGLMDGFHVGQFIQLFENLMNENTQCLSVI